MTLILKYIFRIDFNTCFDILDRPGTALQIMKRSAADPYWDSLGVSRERTGVSVTRNGRKRGRSESSTLTLDIVNIHGTFISEKGIELDSLVDHSFLRIANESVENLKSEFAIYKIERLGFRIFGIGGSVPDFSDAAATFRKKVFNEQFLARVEKVGSFGDFATVIEGSFAGASQFRFTTGPGGSQDRERMLGEAPVEAGDVPPHAFSIDLDVFERDIDLKNSSLYRWVKARYPEMLKLVDIASRSSETNGRNS